jgi:hypothetical protein
LAGSEEGKSGIELNDQVDDFTKYSREVFLTSN